MSDNLKLRPKAELTTFGGNLIQSQQAQELKSNLPSDLQRVASASTEKGASSWLSTLPIEDHGFALHKGAFRDALCFRYGWRPPLLPSQCVCGAKFTIEHSLNCPRGGFPSIRHNEIRDINYCRSTQRSLPQCWY